MKEIEEMEEFPEKYKGYKDIDNMFNDILDS